MSDYERIASVIRYLDEHHAEQPNLETLAGISGLSMYHFHRMFSRWAGITPKDFLQCLTLVHAKTMLRKGASVLDSALDIGLSGPGRLHDLCVNLESASPGEIKSGGNGWMICAGFADTPFGHYLVAEGPRGLCHLEFLNEADEQTGWSALQKSWFGADLKRDDEAAQRLTQKIFEQPINPDSPLKACIRGTHFQLRVWKALLRVPPGLLVSYGHIAAQLGQPTAARAVGAAVGKNPLAYLVPCHRVIRETGVLGGYRWGLDRKQAIIAWESAMSYATHQA